MKSITKIRLVAFWYLSGQDLQWHGIYDVCGHLAVAAKELGGAPILSATVAELVSVSYMGAAFGPRSILGFGAGAISPVVLGVVLDVTNPGVAGNGAY